MSTRNTAIVTTVSSKTFNKICADIWYKIINFLNLNDKILHIILINNQFHTYIHSNKSWKYISSSVNSIDTSIDNNAYSNRCTQTNNVLDRLFKLPIDQFATFCKTKLNQLKTCDFNDTKIDDKHLLCISTNCGSNLRCIILSKCPNISDMGIL